MMMSMTTGARSAARGPRLLVVIALSLSQGGALALADSPEGKQDPGPLELPAEVEVALERAGPNGDALAEALRRATGSERPALEFLIENMPEPDLRTLETGFLLENVRLAFEVREEAPWGKEIPDAIFLNDILPYAFLNERRERWRKLLRALCRPLVRDAKTAGDAAQTLNRELFPLLGVRYSPKRRKPDQSPLETIETGTASCTGLSILLAAACRSVGVPARVAGTPSWVDGRGNHTWVEIWDQGWHFLGAAEPDPKGLDHAWFESDASRAVETSRRHAIYASSFRGTGLSFPLVWAPDVEWVSAVNVTRRYADEETAPPSAPDAPVEAQREEGIESVDRERLETALREFFATDGEGRERFRFDPSLDALLSAREAEVRRMVWRAYREATFHETRKRDFERQVVRFGEHVSPYTLRQVGEKPSEGWPLFIALHGGGGVPKDVNDRQWEVMQTYYHDQPTVPGYLYLALRAPNDRWNGFYDDYVYPLVEELIKQLILFGEVDSDRVFLLGYSHGGYGAFTIGPKLADRFAAVHASAAAPTDGGTPAKNLRNTTFTYMIGEHDHAYGRVERCRAFDATIRKLRGGRRDIYPVTLEYREGYGHRGLPDRDKIGDMYPEKRDPAPRKVSWEMTDKVVGDFFWLSVEEPFEGAEIEASCTENDVIIEAKGLESLIVRLDRRLVDFGQPVRFRLNGREFERALRPSLETLCRTLVDRGDIALAFTAEVELTVAAAREGQGVTTR